MTQPTFGAEYLETLTEEAPAYGAAVPGIPPGCFYARRGQLVCSYPF